MSDTIDMIQLVRDLPTRSRGRACIVLTHEYSGQKGWASELARRTNSEHIDLLDLFLEDRSMSERLREFLVAELFEFLRDRAKAPVLIISGIEFLKATWSGQPSSIEQFASQVETWKDSLALIFVMQYDKTIATRQFRRHRQYTFVVDQKETIAL